MHRLAALAWSLLLAVALLAAPASAQLPPAAPEASPGQPAAAEPAPRAEQPPARRLLLPVVIIALPDRLVAPAVLAAVRDALVAGLTPTTGGRPVVALTDDARVAAVATCHDPICLGARLNELQAQTGVLVRATRRNRFAPIELRLEALDPVSGASRLAAPIVVQLPATAEASPAALLAPAIAQLAPAMPAPPPPAPTLLVVTNVEGAIVTVDGRELGRAPVAPIELPPGRYNVVVAARGWRSGNRMVQLAETGPARADFDLEPEPQTLAALESGRGGSSAGARAMPGGQVAEDPTPLYLRWYVLAGAAAVVATVVVVAIVASSGGTEVGPPQAIPVPPIQYP